MNDFEVGLVQTHPSRRLSPCKRLDYAPGLSPVSQPHTPPRLLCSPKVQRLRLPRQDKLLLLLLSSPFTSDSAFFFSPRLSLECVPVFSPQLANVSSRKSELVNTTCTWPTTRSGKEPNIFFGGGGLRKKKTTKNVVNIVEQLALLGPELLRSSRLAERAFKMSANAQRSERFVNKLLVKEKML